MVIDSADIQGESGNKMLRKLQRNHLAFRSAMLFLGPPSRAEDGIWGSALVRCRS